MLSYTGSDYSDGELEFTFPSGSMVGDTACQTVAISNDNLIEENEQFRLSISQSQPDPVTGNDSVLVTIEDNDGNRYRWYNRRILDLQISI